MEEKDKKDKKDKDVCFNVLCKRHRSTRSRGRTVGIPFVYTPP